MSAIPPDILQSLMLRYARGIDWTIIVPGNQFVDPVWLAPETPQGRHIGVDLARAGSAEASALVMLQSADPLGLGPSHLSVNTLCLNEQQRLATTRNEQTSASCTLDALRTRLRALHGGQLPPLRQPDPVPPRVEILSGPEIIFHPMAEGYGDFLRPRLDAWMQSMVRALEAYGAYAPCMPPGNGYALPPTTEGVEAMAPDHTLLPLEEWNAKIDALLTECTWLEEASDVDED